MRKVRPFSESWPTGNEAAHPPCIGPFWSGCLPRGHQMGLGTGLFGWALTHARAYAFSGNPIYVRTSGTKLTVPCAHPPNWASEAVRDEVALDCWPGILRPGLRTPRRRTNVKAFSSFGGCRRAQPGASHHPGFTRRAQNNNHLLSEAAGLYTAGLYNGPSRPKAAGPGLEVG